MAEKIQPMALPGRWATISAPTTMNAAKASSSGSVSLKAPGPKVPLATDSATSAATPAVQAASIAQAIQVERFLTPRLLVGSWSALLRSFLLRLRPGSVTVRRRGAGRRPTGRSGPAACPRGA
jgi:hypothetical protein